MTELPLQHVCKEEEEGRADLQLCNQERKASVDEREPVQIKEEQEELCVSQEGEQLRLKQEADAFMLTVCTESNQQLLAELPQQLVFKKEEEEEEEEEEEKKEGSPDQHLCNQESNHVDQKDSGPPYVKEEQGELCSSLEAEQLVPKQETETFASVATCEESDSEPELNSHHQLVSHKSPAAEGQHQQGNRHEDSGSTTNAEPKKRLPKNASHNNDVYNSATTESHCNTPMGKKSLQCEICGKDFQFKSKLIIHLRSHTGEKPYLCKSCGKSFSQTAHLNEHLKIHRDEKPYPCKTCGKGHRTSKALLVHTRTHTGEKPYLCKACGKSFSQKSHLNEHTKTHRNEKPYSCKTCGKGLRSRKALVIHTRIHTGEKPYACDTCGKSFSHKSSLNGHLKIHTDEKPCSRKTLHGPQNQFGFGES